MTMLYDSTNWQAIPDNAEMVAGYIDGAVSAWPPEAWVRWPNALRVTVLGQDGADFCDCETGDLTPVQAAAWYQRNQAGGIYCNVSTWPAVQQAVADLMPGVRPPLYWIADWTGQPHAIAGAWAVQYANDQPGANGGQVDLSVLAAVPDPPDPGHVWKVKPVYNVTLDGPIADVRVDLVQHVYVLTSSGAVYAFNGGAYFGGANGQDYFAGRQAATLTLHTDDNGVTTGYTITATSGETYTYPVGAPNPPGV